MRDNHSFDNKKILIIDDNKTNILLLKNMLSDYGYSSMYSASSAKEAYKCLEKENIDLILLDVMMPEIDGIEACSTIKRMPKHKNTPIIMVTSDNNDETLKKSFDAGADDFATKPVNFINLNTRIQNLFILKEKDELILNQTRSTAINDIIGELSHQWRQPLSAISATAMNIGISYELNNLNKEDLDKYLKDITEYTQELSKTIDDLSDMSKVDYELLSVDINKLIGDVINIIENGYKNNNIGIELKEGKLKDIFIYQNELKKVILNILINSQEAFVRNNIETNRLIEITTIQNDDFTQVLVKDNAGGINHDHLTKVFDPYFSTKNEKNGKGLGLHQCKQIIEQHQRGKINITSSNGDTIVTIKIPNTLNSIT